MNRVSFLAFQVPGVVGMLALILSIGAISGCDRSKAESMKELSQGMRWYHDGVFVKARARFKAAAEADPDNDQAHFFLGMVTFHQLKDPVAAEASLRRALELKPEHADYAYQLASVLLARGGDAEAEGLLRKTLAQQPDQAEASYRLGTILQRKEQFEETIRLYTRTIELKPRFSRPYIDLANLYQQYEHLPEALKVMEIAAHNCPGDAEVHHEFGRMLAAAERHDQAIEQYRKALEIKPDYEGALFNLGMAYLARQERLEAARFLRRYLARARRSEDPVRVDSAEMTIAKLEQEAATVEKP